MREKKFDSTITDPYGHSILVVGKSFGGCLTTRPLADLPQI